MYPINGTKGNKMKKDDPKNSEIKFAGLLYAAAYRTQHMLKDATKARVLYKEIITAYPYSREAGYARSQIRAIEGSIVPTYNLTEPKPINNSAVSKIPSS